MPDCAASKQNESSKAVRQNRISAVPSVIDSQSADADNVPTTCVILASLHVVAAQISAKAKHVWEHVLPPSLSLFLPAPNSVM